MVLTDVDWASNAILSSHSSSLWTGSLSEADSLQYNTSGSLNRSAVTWLSVKSNTRMPWIHLLMAALG